MNKMDMILSNMSSNILDNCILYNDDIQLNILIELLASINICKSNLKFAGERCKKFLYDSLYKSSFVHYYKGTRINF